MTLRTDSSLILQQPYMRKRPSSFKTAEDITEPHLQIVHFNEKHESLEIVNYLNSSTSKVTVSDEPPLCTGNKSSSLLLILVTRTSNVVEPKLIVIFGGSNDTERKKVGRIIHCIERMTDRIQSRRLFFFRNFLVRYFKYLLEKGMFEVTVILVLPVKQVRDFNIVKLED